MGEEGGERTSRVKLFPISNCNGDRIATLRYAIGDCGWPAACRVVGAAFGFTRSGAYPDWNIVPVRCAYHWGHCVQHTGAISIFQWIAHELAKSTSRCRMASLSFRDNDCDQWFVVVAVLSRCRSHYAVVHFFRVLASLLLGTFLAFGLCSAIRRHFDSHRSWMIRSYALVLGTTSQGLLMVLWEQVFGTVSHTMHAILFAAGWLLTLAIAERVFVTSKNVSIGPKGTPHAS